MSQPAAEDVPTPIADVSGRSIKDLLNIEPGSVLARSLKELLDQVDRNSDAISGWSSHVDS